MSDPDPYIAMALQLTARGVEHLADRAAVDAQVAEHVGLVGRQLAGSKAFVEQFTGAPLKLVVLPEYLFTSFPGRIGVAEWGRHAAWDVDGPEYARLGELAAKAGVFLAVNAYERDAAFPGLYFQASCVIDPAGAVALRYRRVNSMYAPTPHDLMGAYVEAHGADALFPVADTAIGRLAAIASEEILYPEIARALALKGAEVFVHSSSEIGSPRLTHKQIARRARAIENLAYVVSANTAGIAAPSLPLACADGNSAVIDHDGAVLAEANAGETMTAFAEIDLGALRRARRKPGMKNYLARQRLELFAPTYAGSVQPADALLKDGVAVVPDREHFRRVAAETVAARAAKGLI